MGVRLLISKSIALSTPLCHSSMMIIGVVEASMERDRFMTPLEAKEFGIIDHVREDYSNSTDKDS